MKSNLKILYCLSCVILVENRAENRGSIVNFLKRFKKVVIKMAF